MVEIELDGKKVEVKEGSMVLFGSNDATTILMNEPTKVTPDNEPPSGTQSEFFQNIIKNLKN